jgi:hypothetical protein
MYRLDLIFTAVFVLNIFREESAQYSKRILSEISSSSRDELKLCKRL